ncbi:DUF551 domain-containing protein [Enterobacter kobei]|uniref:DUF551 domain-containing protein n=1 Tax=Enterobacter kobei TaxID=208224 RepID=UPI003858F03C
MSTITKEWLQQKIADMEAARDEIPFGLDENDSNTLVAMKLALASLEAEAVCYIDAEYAELLKSGHIESCSVYAEQGEGCITLYIAPPAPVSVPDAYTRDERGRMMLNGKPEPRIGYGEGWNACRAAMLQGAEPVTPAYKSPDDFDFDRFNDVVWLEAVASNPHMHSLTTSTIAMVALELNRKLADCNSPVIQDGWVACVERMPSAGEQVLAYRPDAPESNDPLIKMATYVGGSAHGHGFDCYCKPTHWMPLPAAPQQELK